LVAIVFGVSMALAALGTVGETAVSAPTTVVEGPSAPLAGGTGEVIEPPASPAGPLATVSPPTVAVLDLGSVRFEALPALQSGGTSTSLTGPTASGAPMDATTRGGGVRWRPLIRDSLVFLTVQHAFRATFEDGTWDETTEGVFWDDYFASVKTLCCWDDGDKKSTNYFFHPLMGSTTTFVFANNHGDAEVARPGGPLYWSAKGKALAYSFVYSAYFEIGPVLSESAIGNVGLKPGQQTFVDFVITPVFGLGWSIGEDVLRVHLIEKVNRKSRPWGIALALLLNPTRSVANVMSGKAPWSAPIGLTGPR
jgi:hypothetical protein